MSSEGSHPPAAGSSGSLPRIETPSLVGQILDGRYRIIAKLGEGGMGEVYAAEHVHIDKRVAIKLLRSEIVANEEAVRRFQQEARSASSLKNRNIIGIEDFGKLPDGRIYMCMELLEGKALNDLIAEPVAPERLINILIQTGHGLAAAHAKGIVHRDMKPENIFVTHEADQDVPKLLDFGIAKVAQQEGSNHLTRTGTIFGTPFYMAPEQALGQGIDHRADIYAMGVIMYECFCGAVPFQGESFMGILTQHITAEPRPPSQMAAMHGRFVPPGVEDIILRAMKKNPDERFATMQEMVQSLVGVYRTVAGAGMSTYMAAAPVPSAVYQVPHSTPQQALQQMPPSGGYPGVAPVQGYGSPTPFPPQYPGSDSSMAEMPRRRSGAGMFIAIFVVLALLGGGLAALLMFKGGDDEGDETADNGTGTTGTDNGTGTTGTDNGTGTTGTDDGTGTGTTGTGTGAGTGVTGTDTGNGTGTHVWSDSVDAGVPDNGQKPPEVKPVSVIVNSAPQGAVGYQKGQRLDKTPFIIKVVPGEPVEIVLKRDGYKDGKLVIDGTLERVTAALDKKRGGRPNNNNNGKPPKDPNELEPGVLGGDD